MDIAIVLDGSNSIWPWEPVVAFLKKVLASLDIGPQKTQACSSPQASVNVTGCVYLLVDFSYSGYLSGQRCSVWL